MRVLSEIFLLCAMLSSSIAYAQRHQVGEVGGAPVYSDQIAGEDVQARADSARSVFLRPVLDEWYRQNGAELRITEAEGKVLETQVLAFSKCSNSGYELPQDPKWRTATLNMLGGSVKAQKLLYEQFGGGRLLFQQSGVEAFDATRRLLEERESAGAFAITDPEVRALAYEYWTREHGSMFITDPIAISRALRIDSVIARCPGT